MLKYSKLSDYKIKKIMTHFCVDIPATKAALLLNMNRNTVTRFFKLFREAICYHQENEFKKFVGEIELDESYFGARRKRGFKGKLKRGRGTQKQPVFGILVRNGKVYTEIIPNCKKKTLHDIIKGKVDLESLMFTDGWRGYNGLVDVGYQKHYRVNHGKNEFSKGDGKHINGIENFWSFTKRRLNKFNGVKKYFILHLKDCEWRYGKEKKQLEKELIKIFKTYNKKIIDKRGEFW